MLSFGVKGGKETGSRVVDNLKVISNLANVGDLKTLIIHPASTTHSQMSESELTGAGIGPEMLRLSVGTEHVDDILADLEQAFKAAGL